MAKITFEDKVALLENADIPEINKVTDDNINEIKSVVNENDDKFLTNGVNIGTSVDSSYRTNILHSKNLLNKNGFRNGYISYEGVFTSENQTATFSQYVKVQSNTDYIMSVNETIRSINIVYYNASKTFISRTTTVNNISQRQFTTPNNCEYVLILISKNSSDTMTQAIIDSLQPQLEIGTTPTTYEPYITPSIVVDNDEIYKSGEFAFFYKKIVKPSYDANFNFLLDNGTMGTIYINELGTTKYYVGTFNKVSGQSPVFNTIGNNGITIASSNAGGTVVLSGATTNSNLRVCIIGCQMDFAI